MLHHEYQTMRNVEDTYWWYRTLRGMVVREVQSRLSANPGRLLDAGCGTGGMMAHLREANENWKISGVDISPAAVEITRDRGFTNVSAGSISKLPFADAAFDGVISLDVLYHSLVDQDKALSELKRVLVPGGFLVLNLPAFDFLAGSHDKAVGGARRYTIHDVQAMLKKEGFRVDVLHYWNAWLFPPILVWRVLSQFLQPEDHGETKSDLKPLSGPLNNTLATLSSADAHLCRFLGLPFGTSVFAVATRV